MDFKRRIIKKRNIKSSLGLLLALATIAPAFASSEALVDFENFQNLNSKNQNSSNQSWFQMGGVYKESEGRLKGMADADVRYYLDQGQSSFSVSQLYLEYQSQKKNSYTLGRKIVDWNPNESFWQLGHINGLRNFRLMDDKEEGLVGLHYKTKSDNIETQIFFSYFFVPTMNPGMEVKNGQVTSPMNWVKLPPTKTIAFGKETPIHYEMDRPATKDIILKKSLGMQVKYDWDSGNIAAFSLYKPENNLRINADAPFDPFLKQVMVTAHPVVNHHIIYGTNFSQSFKGWDFSGGYISIDPNARLGDDFDSLSGNLDEERKTFNSDFFTIDPKYEKETYVHMSATFQQKFRSLSFHYLNYLTNHEKGSDDFYSETTKFANAVGAQGKYLFSDQFATSVSIRYDLKRRDNLFSTEVIYKPYRHLRLGLGMELIRSPQKESYWSAYRANDTVYTSLGYLF